MVASRIEAGPVLAEIIEVGAGHDLAGSHRADRAVEVGLAEEAAVDRIGAVARVGELAGVDDPQGPALIVGEARTREVASSGTAGETACTASIPSAPSARCAALASVMESTPPLTATVTGAMARRTSSSVVA